MNGNEDRLGNKNYPWTRAKAMLCWKFSLMFRISSTISRRVYCKQENVSQNSPSPQGCSEEETYGKMGMKQLVSSA
jgi:hypothetical protein